MDPARSSKTNNSCASIGLEAKLWLAADKLRSNVDAAEYEHTVLGLIYYAMGPIERASPRLTNYVLTNPPVSDSDWSSKDDDVRWQSGFTPRGNASAHFDACIQR